MKRIITILFLVSLLLSCGSRPGDPFPYSFLLNTFGNIRIPVYERISEPVFDSEDSFWTAAKEDRRILYRSNLEGHILDKITLYFLPAVQNIDNFEMGPDMSSTLFTVSTDNSVVRDICKITFSSSDHSAFQLDDSASFLIPNPSSLSITNLSEPWGNQVAYLGTEYNDTTHTATQKVYIYDYSTGTTQTVDLDPGIYPFNTNRELSGNYYDRIDAFPNTDSPDQINRFIICQRMEGTDSVTHSYKIIRSDGSVDFDAAGTYDYDEIGGIRLLSQDEVIMTVKKDGLWQILSVNSQGSGKVFYQGSKDIYSLKGLSLSPMKERCMTQIYYHENDSYSEILIQNIQ